MLQSQGLRAAAGNIAEALPIEFVGVYNIPVGTGNVSSVTITFGGNLTGGLSSSPQEGDIVFVAVGGSAGSTRTFSNSSGFTLLNNFYVNNTGSTADCCFAVFYKVMGSTPDTSINISVTTATNMIWQVYVLRNVDTSNPIDVTQTTATTATDGSVPNPPAITPVTPGSAVIAIGAGAGTGAMTGYTASDLIEFSSTAISGFFRIGTGIKQLNWASGVVDPAAFSGGGSSTRATASVTIAVRAKGVPPKSVSYVTTVTDPANLTSYTFNNVSIGTPRTDRLVVVVVQTSSTTSHTATVTIGGVAATAALNTAAGLLIAMFARPIPQGTTATIVVTASAGTPTKCVVNVYTLYGLSSNTRVAAIYADITGTTASSTLTSTAGGIIIGAAQGDQTAGQTFTWDSPLIENYDAYTESRASTAASGNTPTTSTTATVSWTSSMFCVRGYTTWG